MEPVQEGRKEEYHDSTHTEKIVKGHGDVIALEALGDDLPPGYFTSSYFIGTVAAIVMGASANYWGSVINAKDFIKEPKLFSSEGCNMIITRLPM